MIFKILKPKNLKKINFILFLFWSISIFGQKKTAVNWENPNNFKKYNLRKVLCYTYKVSKKGDIKKDSTLVNEFIYDSATSSISGLDNYFDSSTHGISHYKFFRFKNEYIKDTIVIKKEKHEINSKDFVTKYEEYLYNDFNKLVKKTALTKSLSYDIFKKDTVSSIETINNPIIYEFQYDLDQNLISEL